MMWRAGLLVRVLLTLSASLVVTGCTERQVHVTGVSGPIVWQVTDFRIVESIGNSKAFSPRSLRRPPPPERPAARGSTVWTSGSVWARGAPQRCPGGQAAGRAVGNADGQREGKRSERGDTPSRRARRQRDHT